MNGEVSQDLASLVIHRDADLLVLNKPPGVIVHRTARSGPTLEDSLDSLRFGLERVPGLAHRLDRETSGCLVLGRHPAALRDLNRLFAEGAVAKSYWAVVEGVPASETGEIDLPLLKVHRAGKWSMVADPAGQASTTHWRVLGTAGQRSWVELRPITGRTHQLRVHSAAMGWPLIADRRYGRPGRPGETLHLHARSVRFAWRRRTIEVVAPPPLHMLPALQAGGFESSQNT